MAMHAQTPVQIAWATRDIESTERALATGFPDDASPGLHRVAVAAPDPEWSTSLSEAKADGVPVLSRALMPRGMQIAHLWAPNAAVPHLEIACIPPQVQSFFDYVKQEQAS